MLNEKVSRQNIAGTSEKEVTGKGVEGKSSFPKRPPLPPYFGPSNK